MDQEMLSESELDDRLDKGNPIDRAALDDEGVLAALACVRRSVESGSRREAPSHSARRPVYLGGGGPRLARQLRPWPSHHGWC